jgi:predicted acyltransferase
MLPSSRRTELNPATERLLSIDALRGFDMFWIIGGEELFRALASAGKGSLPEKIEQPLQRFAEHLEHVEWAGFHFYDLIFPLFLFLVGAVIPFSLGKLYEQEVPNAKIYGRIIRRTILLFVLGLVYNGLFRLNWIVTEPSFRIDPSKLRIAGVLQRIAICYFFAAIIVMNFGIRAQLVISVILLIGYWALLAFVPVPGATEPYHSMRDNLAAYVDQRWLPGLHVEAYYKYGDNEGLLSTIPALVTALMGAMAGQWLRSPSSPWWKMLGLTAAGLICLVAGLAWGRSLRVLENVSPDSVIWFPIIKNIWTSSFVLVAGGLSLLLLATFYAIIDVIRFRWWAYFFVVIGANAITIYLLKEIIPFERIAAFFLGQPATPEHAGYGAAKLARNYGQVVIEAGAILLEWLLLLFLYVRRIFLRV